MSSCSTTPWTRSRNTSTESTSPSAAVAGAPSTWSWVRTGCVSRTRSSCSAPEQQFHRYLGYCFSIFTMPNTFELSHGGCIWNTPAGAGGTRSETATNCTRSSTTAHPEPPGRSPPPPRGTTRTRHAPPSRTTAGKSRPWSPPCATRTIPFFDTVSQVHLTALVQRPGRRHLLGDAAYAPSFLTGRGSSLALVGAYMLAGSLTRPSRPRGRRLRATPDSSN
ncbi:hypothetical protein LV779_12335 [Streptomyces thinghirensis]|nr:hypothetical protein [Streptomyces thinghirensis]